MNKYENEFKEKLPKIYSKELLECIFYEVYTKISYVQDACDVNSCFIFKSIRRNWIT